MTQWLLVSGDFRPHGGMDRANFALASALARAGQEVRVELVTHHAAAPLADEGVRVHLVRRPFGAHLLGAPLLSRAAGRHARNLPSGSRLVANGGNADLGDIAWVHYLHAAYQPRARGLRRRLQARLSHIHDCRQERRSLRRARVIVCNSRRTHDDVADKVRIDPARLRVVYYGIDAGVFSYVSPEARRAARTALGWDPDRPAAIFIGALSDRRKGFDRVLEAWRLLCQDARWDVDLVAVGTGSELPAWTRRAAAAGLKRRVRFLGFRTDVPQLLAAGNLLVHPARYEAYGLGIHEAICRGLPAIVSATAGIAERYPPALREWLIEDAEDAPALADRVQRWRRDPDAAAERVRPFSDALRGRSWDDMAREFIAAVQA